MHVSKTDNLFHITGMEPIEMTAIRDMLQDRVPTLTYFTTLSDDQLIMELKITEGTPMKDLRESIQSHLNVAQDLLNQMEPYK